MINDKNIIKEGKIIKIYRINYLLRIYKNLSILIFTIKSSDILGMSKKTPSATTLSEPLLTEDDSRYVMFPLKDHDIWQMYKKQVDCF